MLTFGVGKDENMETIKGLKLTVTVGIKVVAEEIGYNHDKKTQGFNEWHDALTTKGIDSDANVTVDLNIDEAEGENLFGEVKSVISKEITNQIVDQVVEQVRSHSKPSDNVVEDQPSEIKGFVGDNTDETKSE